MTMGFDISHALAGGLVLLSFLLLYQTRMLALINIFAMHAVVLSLGVLWQGYIQDAPTLYVTAAVAFIVKAVIIPIALRRVVEKLDIQGVAVSVLLMMAAAA